MIVIKILASLWSIGVTVGVCSFLWSMIKDRYWVMAILTVSLGFPISFFAAILPWVAIHDISSPTLAILKKGEWACTSQKVETRMQPVVVGRMVSSVPTTAHVCTQYSAVS